MAFALSNSMRLPPPNTNNLFAKPTVSSTYNLSYPRSGDWYANTGSTHHFTSNKSHYREVTNLLPVSTGTGYVNPGGLGRAIMKVPLSTNASRISMCCIRLSFPVIRSRGVKLYTIYGRLLPQTVCSLLVNYFDIVFVVHGIPFEVTSRLIYSFRS